MGLSETSTSEPIEINQILFEAVACVLDASVWIPGAFSSVDFVPFLHQPLTATVNSDWRIQCVFSVRIQHRIDITSTARLLLEYLISNSPLFPPSSDQLPS